MSAVPFAAELGRNECSSHAWLSVVASRQARKENPQYHGHRLFRRSLLFPFAWGHIDFLPTLSQCPWSPFCMTIRHILERHRIPFRMRNIAFRARFAEQLKPIDAMLATSPFILGDRPLFSNYYLYGVLGNDLFNGKTGLPNLKSFRRWHHAITCPSEPTHPPAL